MKNISLSIVFALFGMLFFNGCIEDDYAEPTITTPVFDGEANTSIKELKKIYTDAFPNTDYYLDENEFVTLEDDIIIEGYVVSSDQYGNFYKNIVIQETTDGSKEGINISIDESGLFTNYRVGQKVFIKCKDLVLGKYGGEVQLGAGKYYYKDREWRLSPIASPSVDLHVFQDGEPVAITPKTMKIAELSDDNVFTLVKLDNVQFKVSEKQTWANVNPEGSSEGAHNPKFPFKETIIEDMDGEEMVVFTSDYAKFAHQYTPGGSGSIVGVLSQRTDRDGAKNWQFLVSSLEDVDMTGDRFDDSSKPIEGEENAVYDFKLDFTGHDQNADFSMTNWLNYAEKGSRKWYVQKDKYSENIYASCSNYGTGDAEMVSWLVTPQVDATTQKYLALSTAQHHWAHDADESPIEIE